jgi:hypothetical protein
MPMDPAREVNDNSQRQQGVRSGQRSSLQDERCGRSLSSQSKRLKAEVDNFLGSLRVA